MIPAAQAMPASRSFVPTRMICTTSGPGLTIAASQTPSRAAKADAVTYRSAWSAGVRFSVSMFTWGGSDATQRIASATSSAKRFSLPS